MYIDSHTHITNRELDVSTYLEDIKIAKEKGLVCSLLVLTEAEEEKLYDELHEDDYFDFARGIFPTDADKYTQADLDHLKDLLVKDRFVALGEIGLDYHWAKEIKDEQIELFIKQIDIANQLDLPIIIHSRDAMGDTYDVLRDHPCKRKGVLHSFSGSKEMAERFIELGYYISFSGTITFKNNVHGIRALEAIDLDHLLCETDAPYLAPEPVRGRPNKTYNVIHTYEFIAKKLDISVERLQDIVYANYMRLFHQ